MFAFGGKANIAQTTSERRACDFLHCRSSHLIFGLADLSSQVDCDDVSTFRKAQKYSRETPKQSSTLLPPNSATRVTSLMRAGQTFRQATQVQTLGLCPNQDWPR